MILDATAGNRTMWEKKNVDNIVYIDIEKKLDVRPTIWASNEQTPFPDKTFDVIFYDPPHNWGASKYYFAFASARERKEFYPKASGVPTYYGWDKFKTRPKLIKHMYNAQKEFQRILKDDGILWFKWNEMRMLLNRVLTIFHDWHELMRLYINDPTHTAGEHQTYWICMCKKREKTAQQPLLQFL